MSEHVSILVEEYLAFFADRKIQRFVDGTVGAGGHAHALLEMHSEIEIFYGLDQDPEALEIAEKRLEPFKEKVSLVHGSFFEMDQLVEGPVEGIFLDLGVSSMQLDRPEKGFSLYKEGPLDMRMNPEMRLDAATVVNTFSQKELERIFRDYGEEPRARAVSKAIVEVRRKKKFKTTTDLTEALKRVLTWGGRRGKKIHPMTLVFQALRIYVNNELKGLEEMLPKGVELLNPGGRFGVLTFHSLEDRIVKHTFRQLASEKKVTLLTKKPLIPDSEEMQNNPRSRSAKLRFVEKL
ncbi:MAG: Ribosomal RNA small subunit methyltransferase H [Chlamydiales bacterium]|nr:Ribosomal RNA small subunit methyltransferase H [Chlamydiales bacterium]